MQLSHWLTHSVLADFNNDHILDIAVANVFNKTVSIFRGYGNGTFRARTEFSVGTEPHSIVCG